MMRLNYDEIEILLVAKSEKRRKVNRGDENAGD